MAGPTSVAVILSVQHAAFGWISVLAVCDTACHFQVFLEAVEHTASTEITASSAFSMLHDSLCASSCVCQATSTADKSFFEVSHREWLFCQEQGDAYHIYR